MEVYTHQGNHKKYTLHKEQNCWPGQTYCIPLGGQRDVLPRYLSTGLLRDSKGNLPRLDSSTFQVGDIVVLKNGSSPIKITSINTFYHQKHISGEYLKSGYLVTDRKVEDFIMYKEATTQGKNTMTLYQFTVNADTKYGTYLATNSQGMFVMEEKGSGVIYTVNKDVVEEVMPYTIDVVFLNSADTVYGYLAETNKYKVGDVYLLKTPLGHSLVTVVKVDTKSKKATKDFNPISKITTETL
jgi:hypothetical protein